jgi:hypothetical protein
VNGHRCTVRKVGPAQPVMGVGSTWESTCLVGCGRYLTDGGWRDAMAHSIAHYWGSVHGWVHPSSRSYREIGWSE